MILTCSSRSISHLQFLHTNPCGRTELTQQIGALKTSAEVWPCGHWTGVSLSLDHHVGSFSVSLAVTSLLVI